MRKRKIVLYYPPSNTTREVERYVLHMFNRNFYLSRAFDFVVEKRWPRGQFECLAVVMTLIILVFNPLLFLVIEPLTISNLFSFLFIQSIMTAVLVRPW